MRRKVTVVLSTIFFRGGIPRFNQMLCRALDDLAPAIDLDVTVLSQDDTEAIYEEHGRPWRRLEFVPGGGSLGVARKTLAHCVRRRPDLLLIGLMGMTPLGVPCLPFVRRGFGFIAHGYECWDGHPLSDERWSRRWAARRARFAISVSRYTARDLRRITGLDADSVLLLPNTLEPGFDAMERELIGRVGEADPELLTVSRLWAEEKMKGVDYSIQAFARLADRHPRLRFRIVGKGSDKPRLVALVAELGLRDRVIFEEDLTDEQLADRYARCSLFLLPSGQEGFGIVFLEAMRFGKACIGGRAGGTPEVVADGETGLLVDYRDVAELEVAIDRLIGDPELRKRMGRAGRQRLESRFSFDRYRDRVAEILAELLD